MYCENNPPTHTDPDGKEIRAAVDATQNNKSFLEQALEYLKKSDIAKDVIERLEKDDVLIEIKFFDHNKNSLDEDSYWSSIDWVVWDPLLALEKKNGEELSPTIALFHELVHAFQDCTGKNEENTSKEELDKECIEGYETPVAKDLGESPRESHDDATTKTPSWESPVPLGKGEDDDK